MDDVDWDEENVTIDEYLLLTRGSKRMPLPVLVPLTLIYSIILVMGIIGNVAVCFVIKRNPAMHTSTNYHLFSLAVSDLALLLLGLPNDLIVYWQQYPWIFGEAICKLRALISEMTSYTSVLTIVAFSAERYVAICHPMSIRKFASRSRAVKQIAASWMTSFVAASPFAVFTTVNYVDYPRGSGTPLEDSAFCAMLDENIPPGWPIYEISSFFFLLLPMVILVALYSKIALVLKRDTQRIQTDGQADILLRKSKVHKRESVINMLRAVVICFFISWAPFHAQRLLYLYGRNSRYFPIVNEWMYYITGFFYYFSSTINPILYNLMSIKYRKAFRQTFFNTNGSISNFSEGPSLVRNPSTRRNNSDIQFTPTLKRITQTNEDNPKSDPESGN